MWNFRTSSTMRFTTTGNFAGNFALLVTVLFLEPLLNFQEKFSVIETQRIFVQFYSLLQCFLQNWKIPTFLTLFCTFMSSSLRSFPRIFFLHIVWGKSQFNYSQLLINIVENKSKLPWSCMSSRLAELLTIYNNIILNIHWIIIKIECNATKLPFTA